MSSTPKILRVGVIGAGEVAQVVHLPVLSLLSHLYKVVAICDVSKTARDHSSQKFHIPLSTSSPSEIFSYPDIDVIFILTTDQFHESYTISALNAGKSVMLEKPMTLSLPSAERILAAEEAQKGKARVFVGYMRRYALSFTQTFKREVQGIEKVLYARVRDFPGPNPRFVAESGAFHVGAKAGEIGAGEREMAERKLGELLGEAWDGKEVTEERRLLCRFLGTLGSHDISLMREALGTPEGVKAVSVNDPFYSAIFDYRNKDGSKFAVMYESGWDDVPDFDAHIAVYGGRKRVMIKYDSPFVKGLPIKVTVQEVNSFGEVETREMLGSYEDAYTVELQELHDCLVNGKTIKTTVRDAMQDLKIYDAMYRRWDADNLLESTFSNFKIET